jgi:hypothetical protein
VDTWRDIRALRADPPGLAADDATRRKQFGASLQQAEEFAAAAAGTDYATKPLQLYYALSQGSRAACAAHLEDHWQRVGHGLSLPNAEMESVLDRTVKPSSDKHNLHKGAMAVMGEEPLKGPVTIGNLMASLVEFRDIDIAGFDAPRPILLRNPLQRHHVLTAEGRDPSPFLIAAVEGLPDFSSTEELLKAAEPYPALHGAIPTPWPDGSQRMGGIKVGEKGRQERNGVAYLLTEMRPDGLPIFRFPFEGDTAPAYRAAFEELGPGLPDDPLIRIAQPAVGEEQQVLGAFAAWWALLLGLSSLVRYDAAQWSDALAIDHEPIAPALERVIDLAQEVLPLYLLDALTAAPNDQRRTPTGR